MPNKNETNEERTKREKGLAAKLEKKAEYKRKMEEWKKEEIRKANETPSRLSIFSDEYGVELKISPRKFPKFLQPSKGFIWFSVIAVPLLYLIAIDNPTTWI